MKKRRSAIPSPASPRRPGRRTRRWSIDREHRSTQGRDARPDRARLDPRSEALDRADPWHHEATSLAGERRGGLCRAHRERSPRDRKRRIRDHGARGPGTPKARSEWSTVERQWRKRLRRTFCKFFPKCWGCRVPRPRRQDRTRTRFRPDQQPRRGSRRLPGDERPRVDQGDGEALMAPCDSHERGGK